MLFTLTKSNAKVIDVLLLSLKLHVAEKEEELWMAKLFIRTADLGPSKLSIKGLEVGHECVGPAATESAKILGVKLTVCDGVVLPKACNAVVYLHFGYRPTSPRLGT